jgi:hypothetical protein
MDAKQTQIKSHGWHDVTLTGDLLTGDTFKCSDFIKKSLGGKWDGQRKGWIVDMEKVAKHTTTAGTIWESR